MSENFSILSRNGQDAQGGGREPARNPELELIVSAYKSEALRDAMREMYYVMSGGDPKSFPVQFAMLLTGHISVIRQAPDSLRKVVSEETAKLIAPLIAYQTSLRESVESIDSFKTVVTDELRSHRLACDNQVAELKKVLKAGESVADRVDAKVNTLTSISTNLAFLYLLLAALFGSVGTYALLIFTGHIR
jgi:hypothetical protein